MTDRCLRPEDLDGLVEGKALPDWQDHLQSCAACRARLAEYQSFLAAEPTSGADPLAADAALDRRMPTELRRAEKQTTRPAGSDRWSALLKGLRWRPALAAAALAAVLMIAFWPQDKERFTDPSGLVRGHDSLEQDFLLEILDTGAAGSWVLQWHPVTQASDYRIEILDQTMSVVQSQTESQVTRVELDPTALPADTGGTWFVRIIALTDQRELARTPLRELPPRP
jgi:hypothetical protein